MHRRPHTGPPAPILERVDRGDIPTLTHRPVAKFLRSLFLIVSDPVTDPIVCWSEDGTTIVIRDRPRFIQEVLPAYFSHSQYTSFTRQLNFYDFHRHHTPAESARTGLYEFSHPFFQRGRDDLLCKVVRKTNSRAQEMVAHEQDSLSSFRDYDHSMSNTGAGFDSDASHSFLPEDGSERRATSADFHGVSSSAPASAAPGGPGSLSSFHHFHGTLGRGTSTSSSSSSASSSSPAADAAFHPLDAGSAQFSASMPAPSHRRFRVRDRSPEGARSRHSRAAASSASMGATYDPPPAVRARISEDSQTQSSQRSWRSEPGGPHLTLSESLKLAMGPVGGTLPPSVLPWDAAGAPPGFSPLSAATAATTFATPNDSPAHRTRRAEASANPTRSRLSTPAGTVPSSSSSSSSSSLSRPIPVSELAGSSVDFLPASTFAAEFSRQGLSLPAPSRLGSASAPSLLAAATGVADAAFAGQASRAEAALPATKGRAISTSHTDDEGNNARLTEPDRIFSDELPPLPPLPTLPVDAGAAPSSAPRLASEGLPTSATVPPLYISTIKTTTVLTGGDGVSTALRTHHPPPVRNGEPDGAGSGADDALLDTMYELRHELVGARAEASVLRNTLAQLLSRLERTGGTVSRPELRRMQEWVQWSRTVAERSAPLSTSSTRSRATEGGLSGRSASWTGVNPSLTTTHPSTNPTPASTPFARSEYTSSILASATFPIASSLSAVPANGHDAPYPAGSTATSFSAPLSVSTVVHAQPLGDPAFVGSVTDPAMSTIATSSAAAAAAAAAAATASFSGGFFTQSGGLADHTGPIFASYDALVPGSEPTRLNSAGDDHAAFNSASAPLGATILGLPPGSVHFPSSITDERRPVDAGVGPLTHPVSAGLSPPPQESLTGVAMHGQFGATVDNQRSSPTHSPMVFPMPAPDGFHVESGPAGAVVGASVPGSTTDTRGPSYLHEAPVSSAASVASAASFPSIELGPGRDLGVSTLFGFQPGSERLATSAVASDDPAVHHHDHHAGNDSTARDRPSGTLPIDAGAAVRHESAGEASGIHQSSSDTGTTATAATTLHTFGPVDSVLEPRESSPAESLFSTTTIHGPHPPAVFGVEFRDFHGEAGRE